MYYRIAIQVDPSPTWQCISVRNFASVSNTNQTQRNEQVIGKKGDKHVRNRCAVSPQTR
jgi:hypothetical protein